MKSLGSTASLVFRLISLWQVMASQEVIHGGMLSKLSKLSMVARYPWWQVIQEVIHGQPRSYPWWHAPPPTRRSTPALFTHAAYMSPCADCAILKSTVLCSSWCIKCLASLAHVSPRAHTRTAHTDIHCLTVCRARLRTDCHARTHSPALSPGSAYLPHTTAAGARGWGCRRGGPSGWLCGDGRKGRLCGMLRAHHARGLGTA